MFLRFIQQQLLIICLLGYGPLLSAGENSFPELKVVTEEGYPINYTDPDTGEVSGFATDYLRYALDKSGIDYSIKVYTWSRAFKTATKEPNVLIYSMARIPEREDKFHWLVDIMPLRYFLYGRAEDNKTYVGVDNFKPYRIAVVAGSVTHRYLEDDGYDNIFLVRSYEQLNSLIVNKRVDFIASSEYAISHFSNKYNYLPGYFYKYKPLNYVSINLYYALSKGSDPALIERLSQVFRENIAQLKVIQ